MLLDAVKQIAELTQGNLVEASIRQGHKLTGSLQSRIDYKITEVSDGYTVTITAPKYAIYLNFGVSANKVRYPIKVMIEYFRKRGFAEKEATSIAWATRAKHQKEGMPTKASARFSSDGKRTGFVTDAVTKSMNEAAEILAIGASETVRIEIAEMFGKEIEPIVIEI